jgi:hypothetical protein
LSDRGGRDQVGIFTEVVQGRHYHQIQVSTRGRTLLRRSFERRETERWKTQRSRRPLLFLCESSAISAFPFETVVSTILLKK